MAKTSITQLIKEIAQEGASVIVTGVVKGTDPVEIIQKNDIGILLHSQSLVIPGRMLPLEQGEEVYMLSTSSNKIYYVLDRV